MDVDIKWEWCIICQTDTNKDVRQPANSVFDVYSAFLTYVNEFQKLNLLPMDISFHDNVTAETCVEHAVVWYKSCHQKFNNAKLLHAQAKNVRVLPLLQKF